MIVLAYNFIVKSWIRKVNEEIVNKTIINSFFRVSVLLQK